MENENIIKGSILENIAYEEGGPARIVLATIPPVKIARVCLKKGQTIQPHIDVHSAFFIVISGKAVFTQGKNKIELGPNQYLLVEENQQRGIDPIEDLVIVVIRS